MLASLDRIERTIKKLDRYLPPQKKKKTEIIASDFSAFHDDYEKWLKNVFPNYFNKPLCDRHHELWEWAESIDGQSLPAFFAIWPRGSGKSTVAESAIVRLGAKGTAKYVWYISSTQAKADQHVSNIASMLESSNVEKYYPKLASRKLGKYGSSKGWRRNRLRTESGLTVDSLGLDTGSRGAKVEDTRPDLIIFDDVDEKHDTQATIKKKIEIITTSILPAGAAVCNVLFVQNLIHDQSIATKIVDGVADFLTNRIISGPHKAIDGLSYKQIDGKFEITGGLATWEGQSLETCQEQMNRWGLTAFLQEAQHEIEQSGGLWDHIEFQHCEYSEMPEIIRGCVWVDPAVTETDGSDSMGIQADALGVDNKVYRVFSWESVTSPENAIRRAVLKAIELGYDHVGVETDQGGDTWKSVYYRVCEEIKKELIEKYKLENPESEKEPIIKLPTFAEDKAGRGYGSKVERNSRMLVDYEHGMVVHVNGTHNTLERALKRFPAKKPYDLTDAAFWSWSDLRGRVSSYIAWV